MTPRVTCRATRAPSGSPRSVATACAGVERFLGSYEQANARLLDALRGLPEKASVESVGLLIELTLNEFYRTSYDAMREWAGRAVADARILGDPPLTAAALAMPALAYAMTGHPHPFRPTESSRPVRAISHWPTPKLGSHAASLPTDIPKASWAGSMPTSIVETLSTKRVDPPSSSARRHSPPDGGSILPSSRAISRALDLDHHQ